MLLNVLDLVNALKKQHAEVELVQLDSLTLEETAAVLANAKVLVAVSSDDMVSMALLPKGSTVVSIVPFGNPDRVWRPLAKRFGINYVAWHNKDRSKARFHPELLSAYGVVGAEAEEIVNADHYDSEHHNWAGEFYWAMVFVALFLHDSHCNLLFSSFCWNTGTLLSMSMQSQLLWTRQWASKKQNQRRTSCDDKLHHSFPPHFIVQKHLRSIISFDFLSIKKRTRIFFYTCAGWFFL